MKHEGLSFAIDVKHGPGGGQYFQRIARSSHATQGPHPLHGVRRIHANVHVFNGAGAAQCFGHVAGHSVGQRAAPRTPYIGHLPSYGQPNLIAEHSPFGFATQRSRERSGIVIAYIDSHHAPHALGMRGRIFVTKYTTPIV